MNYKALVAEAWDFTQEHKKLALYYGAIPAFFTTGVGVGYIIYQYYSFLSSQLFQNWEHKFITVVLEYVFNFLLNNSYLLLPLIITSIIVLIGYFILPVICQGALIQLVARRKNGQIVNGRKGVNYGLLSFLPLFEYRLLIQTFSVTSVFSTIAFTLRIMGWGIMTTIVPIMIFIAVLGVVLALFLTYTEFFIVIDGEKVFKSMTNSFSLVIKNLEETLLVTILMLIIGLRIIIQILFVLLIPVFVIGGVYLMTLANLPHLGIVVGALMGLIGLVVAAYLTGIIHTFTVIVWTFTFLKLTEAGELNAREGDKVA